MATFQDSIKEKHGEGESSSVFVNHETGERFIHMVMDQLDRNKIEGIIFEQREALSAARLEHVSRELTWYTQMMGDMKKDLDSIFRRLRLFKSRMMQLYPDAFAEVSRKDSCEVTVDANNQSDIMST